ncbi:MAG TPA: amidohydrolase, partial [Planctomycetales bacterium]|nr:amidohydrolase [Planctomycetales bacterium]
MRRAAFLLVALIPIIPLALTAGNETPADADHLVAYLDARILTADGPPIDHGVLIVQQGKIINVGPMDRTPLPTFAEQVNMSGKTIIPGLVDTHSHIGVFSRPGVAANGDGNEGSGAVQSGVRALDSVYPDDPGIRMAVAGGVTTANIMPGSANVIGGQTVYVKLRGRTVEEMQIQSATVLGGLKMANGENPKRFNFEQRKAPPGTRMKIAAMQREQFVKAREYQQKWTDYRAARNAGKDVLAPDVDPALEPLVEVLERKRTVHFHSHRADDLMSAVRLAEEFHFELVLQHATEGYRIADELARRKIPVSLTLIDSPGGKAETAGLLEENAAILNKAGVKVAINTDDYITESRFLLRTGAIAVRGGMSEDSALKALTLRGAEMLHLDDRVGSLTKGKDADFVVLSGSPFSVYSVVLQTFIDGKCLFDRSKRDNWVYQAGGFALADRDRLPATPDLVKPPPVIVGPASNFKTPPFTGGPTRYAVRASRIRTVGKGDILDGVIIVENGKITAVGPSDKIDVPADIPILIASEVTPGLVDADSTVGLSGAFNLPADQDQDEQSDPNQADLRVLDGFNPNEPLLEVLRQNGVTTIHASPGRVNVIAGQTGVFHTSGLTAEAMTLRFPAGLLVNLGEVPKQTYPHKQPTTRMGTAALLRTAFTQAKNRAVKRNAAHADDKPTPADAKLDALGLALDHKIPVIFAAHRADDLQTALRLAKEFDLRARLDLATEGYLMADAIAESKVSVVVHPTMQRAGSSMETLNSQLCNAAVLADHKIPLAIGTGFEGYVPKTRVLRYEAAMAMVNGLGRERALAAVTLDAARILGVDDRVGSIEPGKAADLVLYDGDPFEHTSHVIYTIQDGRVVWD